MRRKQEFIHCSRAMMVATLMLIVGLVFVCYMGNSLIRSTREYQKQNYSMAQKR